MKKETPMSDIFRDSIEAVRALGVPRIVERHKRGDCVCGNVLPFRCDMEQQELHDALDLVIAEYEKRREEKPDARAHIVKGSLTGKDEGFVLLEVTDSKRAYDFLAGLDGDTIAQEYYLIPVEDSDE